MFQECDELRPIRDELQRTHDRALTLAHETLASLTQHLMGDDERYIASPGAASDAASPSVVAETLIESMVTIRERIAKYGSLQVRVVRQMCT